jgi:hypothetical protein
MEIDLEKGESILLKVAGISAAIICIVSAWNFYFNNFWEPKVEVIKVDYKAGIANLLIDGRDFVLRGDSTYLIAYDWGIKFGFTYKENERFYDRIEILKRGAVKKVIKQD